METQTPIQPEGKPRQRYSKEFKLRVLAEAQEKNLTIADLCHRYGIHKSVYYRWLNRYKQKGEEGLRDAAPIPKNFPQETPPEVQAKVVEVKKAHPFLGSRKLRDFLARFEGIHLSQVTVNRILRRFGFKPADEIIQAEARRNDPEKAKAYEEELRQAKEEWQRFCRANPNDLWQIDLSTFFIRGQYRVWLITVLDDHSRFVVNHGLFKSATAEAVLEVLKGAMAKHGLPREILTDNGPQFVTWKGVTRFEKLLKQLGIYHTKARPHHPQTLGKIESFHRNIERELLNVEVFRTMEEAATRIGQYIEHYNYSRPHEGIGGFTPADRYFGIAQEVERWQKEKKALGNEEVVAAGPPAIFVIGKVFGHQVRLEDSGGRLELHVDGKLLKAMDLIPKKIV
jgi:transposase InsO family protein/transposase-like protein